MAKEVGSMVMEEVQVELELFLLPKTITVCTSSHRGSLFRHHSWALCS